MLRIIAQAGNKQECFLIYGQEDYDTFIKINKYYYYYFKKEDYERDLERNIESPILISIGSIYHAAILDLIKYNKEQQIINTIEDVLK